MFYDRSGALSRRLHESLPGLMTKKATFDQRDFSQPSEELDLFFGIVACHVQTLKPKKEDFASIAAGFLRAVTEVLEINQLLDFRYRTVIGKPCASDEEAQKLMWPLVPEDTKAKMSKVAEPAQWQGFQGDFVIQNLSCQSRVAILSLVPHIALDAQGAAAGQAVPHITFQFDVRGLVPVDVASFDAEGFIKNVRDNQSQEILSKLAPHLL